MAAEGAAADGAGPSAADLTAAARALYGPGGGSAADADAYARLRTAVVDRPAHVDAPEPASPAPPAAGRRRRRLIGWIVGAAVAGAVVTMLVAVSRPAPVHQLATPDLAGDTIAAYGRVWDRAVAPGVVTYQPEGYDVYQPGGRVVHVAFRCIGDGEVRISAGSDYHFHCTDHRRQWVSSQGGRLESPFMVGARTTGNVVWAVRVVLRDR